MQDWHKDGSNLPLPVANDKNIDLLGRKNKNHKGISSTVMEFVAAFTSINKCVGNGDI